VTASVTTRWLAAWTGGALLGVANGVLREATFAKVLSERAAHAASGATAVAAFAGYFSILQRRWPIPAREEALKLGGAWVGMTVAFEFAFGPVDRRRARRRPRAAGRLMDALRFVRPRFSQMRHGSTPLSVRATSKSLSRVGLSSSLR
jgi:hypothetical protein